MLSGEYYSIIILEKYDPLIIKSRRDEILVVIQMYSRTACRRYAIILSGAGLLTCA